MRSLSLVLIIAIFEIISLGAGERGFFEGDTSSLSTLSRRASRVKRRELKSHRTYFSKSYLNSDGTVTIEISSGYIHYRDEKGEFHEIERDFRKVEGNKRVYGVKRGLFRAYISGDVGDDYIMRFETRDGDSFRAKVLSMGYMDMRSRRYVEIARFNPDSISAVGNKVYCYNAFPGIDIVYEYMDTRLKERVVLGESARRDLPSPVDFGIPLRQALLVIKLRFEVSEGVEAFAGGKKISKGRRKGRLRRMVFDVPYDGENRIFFCDVRSRVRYFLERDVAFERSDEDSVGGIRSWCLMRRLVYTEGGRNYILTGVPYEWIASRDRGVIELDPSVSIQPPTHDVWIEYGKRNNFNSYSQLRIGRQDGWPWKRSLVKFDLSAIPEDAEITSAKIMLYFYGAYGRNKISRYVKCHQVLKPWAEEYATWYNYGPGPTWNTPGVGFDNVDAKSQPEDCHFWYKDYGWKVYYITNLVRRWVSGEAENYGVIFWAVDEDDYTNGDEKRCYSSEYTGDVNKRPKLVVTCSSRYIAKYSYNVYGRVSRVEYGNRMVEINSYENNRGWLKRRTYRRYEEGEKYRMEVTSFDNVGNILSIKDSYGNHTYEYDNLYRLVSYTGPDGSVREYSYDRNGNITRMGDRTFSISSTSNRITSSGYRYDANGNMTRHNGRLVEYNWRGQMVRYVLGYNINSSYDSFGQRVKREFYIECVYYITSGQNVLEEYNKKQELEALHIYNGISRIATIKGGNIYYVCQDQVMNSRAIVDDVGSVVQERSYYPYGEKRAASGNISKYQYSGKEEDPNGLYYFGARYYDPSIGRWLTCDPAGQFHSPYSYCGNNPLVFVDPDGEWIQFVIGAMINVILNAPNIDDWKDFLGYAAIGAFGAGIGMFGTPANWTLNTAIGAVQGGIVQGLNSSLTARSWDAFGSGFKSGAIAGGIAGFMTSEATINFLRGDGFVNNETLFNRWNDGSIEGYKRIAERFGDGEFVSSDHPIWDQPNISDGGRAMTNRITGKIYYNENAFKDGYHMFLEVSGKEKWLSNMVRSGQLPAEWTNAEVLSFKYLYKNYGLIHPSSSPMDLWFTSNRFLVDLYTGRYCGESYFWKRRWFDWIYRIPRRY
ncbi:MAG: DNRLRE domain-containing protein [Candidatus Marinimicrobia bacterium]|nr:DNRLRE domain-containing protein [Candidatus Neomarinimicrobiota bacterium]